MKLRPINCIVCFPLSFLIILIVFFFSFASLQATPKLEVRQVLEKSSVITGEELQGIIYIKNSGDETLKIRGVSSSCGCTTLRCRGVFYNKWGFYWVLLGGCLTGGAI